MNKCVLFAQGDTFVSSYSHKDEQMCPIRLKTMESA